MKFKEIKEGQIVYWACCQDIEEVEVLKKTKDKIWVWRIKREECYDLDKHHSKELYKEINQAKKYINSLIEKRINELKNDIYEI